MRFEFATAGRIVFGGGAFGELGTIAKSYGRRALVVCGKSRARAERVLELLSAEGLQAEVLSVAGEPTTDDARSGARLARQFGAELVIGIGGGSALDAGKAVAALAENDGDPLDYLELIGAGMSLTRPSLPYIAIPTTAGTGSEVTRNAVLESPEHRVKVSLRSAYMLPTVALVDPALSHDLPPAITASTGFDALSQVLEPFVSNRANPITDGLCREAMRRSTRSLRRAYADGRDAAAREDLAIVSLLGGIALANAKLGAVHGFAGPIGGMFGSPHGATCAVLLPHVMRVNLSALRARDPASPVLERYREVAQLLTGHADASADDGARWVLELTRALAIAPLSSYGLSETDFPVLIAKAKVASSMQGNPITLADAELVEILESAL